ncbi:MAG: hypothetical protein INR63_06715 [Actinomycetospora chiangmaiensis]|nr:hypothetical protein [Actinomycetospora chiangmaiensis]
MLPILSLLTFIPGVGGLIEHAKTWVVEIILWALLALALVVGGIVAYDHVYDRGVAAERGHTTAAQAERDGWKVRALSAEAAAKDNESSAMALGQQVVDQADAYDRADAQARADADRYTAALGADRHAGCGAQAAPVLDPVHRALTGTATPEDAPLPDDATVGDIAPHHVDVAAAGQDCRAKLKAVDGLLIAAERHAGSHP